MKSFLQRYHPYSMRNMEVDADCYNRVRLALRRLENPIRLSIPGLRTIDLLLDDETWIAVDQVEDDMPVVALTDFVRSRDGGLYEPVHCTAYYYHGYAELILERVLRATKRLLDARMRPRRRQAGPGARIFYLNRRKQAQR